MQSRLQHCGFVTIIGRPNVGKSSLLNAFIGQKLSITSRKPQTTRTHLLGIKSGPGSQIIFIDTPGLHKKTGNLLNRYMNREALSALGGVELVIHVIEALIWNDMDEYVYRHLTKLEAPVVLAINKVDRVKGKQGLLPFIRQISTERGYAEIVPISVRQNQNIHMLENLIRDKLPAGMAQFPDDQITDRNEQFFAAEFIREQLTRSLGDELPYNISITIDKFREEDRILRIHATIWVANEGQKKIVIGKDGAVLKKVGQAARKELEKMFVKKVFIETWVKIKTGWTTNPQALKQFGYDL